MVTADGEGALPGSPTYSSGRTIGVPQTVSEGRARTMHKESWRLP
jgi:hypothetical protein